MKYLYTCNMQIIVLDGHTLNPGDLSWEALKKLGNLQVYERTQPSEIVERVGNAEIVLTNKVLLNRNILQQLPHLKYIGVTATGYNIVDMDYARQQGVIVTNVPGYSTGSVAQLCFSLLLEMCLHAQKHSDSVRQGKWSASPDFSFWDYPLMELEGKIMGIIGFGQIGQRVADIASAFGMHVLAYSRSLTDQSHRKHFEWTSLETLFKQADVVSLHCPLTAHTRGMINRETLALMRCSAYLINTARGPLIDEEALAEALNTQQIAGAGLDVLSQEPPPVDHPLLSAKNCLITPHIGWATLDARKRLMQTTIENLKAYLSGESLNQII